MSAFMQLILSVADIAAGSFFFGSKKYGYRLKKRLCYTMNGAGNRFIVLDSRKAMLLGMKSTEMVHGRFDPQRYDQFIIIEPSAIADAFMRIYNADGGEVSACGNATRCVGWLLMRESGKDNATIQTRADKLTATRNAKGDVTVDMGKPRFQHADIPASAGLDLHNVSAEGLTGGMALGMGNPHVVFFVEDADAFPLETTGKLIENRLDLFPERVNVGIAQITGENAMKLRVWERGAGATLACGTGACAAAVAAITSGRLQGPVVSIAMPGGELQVEWSDGKPVLLSGPVELESEGALEI